MFDQLQLIQLFKAESYYHDPSVEKRCTKPYSFKGPLHTRHFCSQYFDKKIKRYCDKKTFFTPNIFFLCVLKIFFWDNSKYFEMSLQYFEEKISCIKISFYLLSFYLNIVCKNSVDKPLT